MSEIPIVDAHIHLWDPWKTPRTASPLVRLLGRWPRALESVAKLVIPRKTTRFVGNLRYAMASFLPETWASKASPSVRKRVEGYFHVEADWSRRKGTQLAGETAWLASLERPPMGAIVGAYLDRDSLDELLDEHVRAAGSVTKVVGVRDKLAHSERRGVHNWAKRGRMLTPAFREGYRRLGARGLTFDAFVYAEQLLELADLAESCPTTPLMLNHLGTPIALVGPYAGLGESVDERARVRAQWEAGIKAVAACPHAYAKLSGMMMPIVGCGYHERSVLPDAKQVVAEVGPIWRFALDAFGWERCVFASNFPMDAVSVEFDVLVDAFERVMRDAGLSDEQLAAVMAGNARRFYGLR